MSDSRRIICRTCAFLVSNFVAYILNVLFVFKPGRHTRLKEFGLFYLASGISFAIGTALSSAAIPLFGITSTTALGINVIVSLSINYAASYGYHSPQYALQTSLNAAIDKLAEQITGDPKFFWSAHHSAGGQPGPNPRQERELRWRELRRKY